MQSIITAATPGLLELLGVALTAIIGWAAACARQKWGIEIEAKHREALQSALLTGAWLALKRELTGKTALDLIAAYVRQSVPDALGKLNPTPELLTDLAKAKLQEVAAEKAGSLTGLAVDRLPRHCGRRGRGNAGRGVLGRRHGHCRVVGESGVGTVGLRSLDRHAQVIHFPAQAIDSRRVIPAIDTGIARWFCINVAALVGGRFIFYILRQLMGFDKAQAQNLLISCGCRDSGSLRRPE